MIGWRQTLILDKSVFLFRPPFPLDFRELFRFVFQIFECFFKPLNPDSCSSA